LRCEPLLPCAHNDDNFV